MACPYISRVWDCGRDEVCGCDDRMLCPKEMRKLEKTIECYTVKRTKKKEKYFAESGGEITENNRGGNIQEMLELKTDFEYIIFRKIADKPKTTVWGCLNKSGEYRLGIVQWNPGWRQYCFFPEGESLVFSIGCLQDIILFIRSLNKAENRSYGRVFKE